MSPKYGVISKQSRDGTHQSVAGGRVALVCRGNGRPQGGVRGCGEGWRLAAYKAGKPGEEAGQGAADEGVNEDGGPHGCVEHRVAERVVGRKHAVEGRHHCPAVIDDPRCKAVDMVGAEELHQEVDGQNHDGGDKPERNDTGNDLEEERQGYAPPPRGSPYAPVAIVLALSGLYMIIPLRSGQYLNTGLVGQNRSTSSRLGSEVTLPLR